jgi:hypothetical protein
MSLLGIEQPEAEESEEKYQTGEAVLQNLDHIHRLDLSEKRRE